MVPVPNKDFIDVKVSNDDETVGLVELIAENVKEGISARIDLDLLKEAIDLAETVDTRRERDVHLIKDSNGVVHLYITRSSETDSGVMVAGKSDYPTPNFNSEPKGENQ